MWTDSHVEELNARTGGASGLRYNAGRSCRGGGLILRLTLRAGDRREGSAPVARMGLQADRGPRAGAHAASGSAGALHGPETG